MKSKGFHQESQTEPETATQFFDRGTEEEESGDRWITSDLSKALRFYQRAFNDYIKALNLDSTHLDARYNASRLLFSVYTEYIKNDGVNLADLTNCDDALAGNESSVIQPLNQIASFFQNSIEVGQNNDELPWDLYYNAAICYFEYVEDMTRNGYETDSQFSQAVDMMKRSESLFLTVLQFQIQELGTLVDAMNGKVVETEDNETDGKTEDTILPSSVLETCLNGYRLVETMYEDACNTNRIELVQTASSDFIQHMDSAVSNLLDQFSTEQYEGIPALTEDEVYELKLTKISYLASQATDFKSCDSIWSEPLENRPEKMLLEAESYRTILDKIDESQSTIEDSIKWDVLTHMNKLYKEAYKQLKSQLNLYKAGRKDSGDEKSDILSQICSIFIEEADIALEKSSLQYKPALDYHDLLVKNCHSLLKNALIFSKQNGGLRESISGKLVRAKRRREALTRMCIIEGKTDLDSLNKIIGEKYWPQEMQDLNDVPLYAEGAARALNM